MAKVPEVAERIRELQAEAAGLHQDERQRTIREIGRLAFSSIDQVLSFGPGGVKIRDSSELSPDQLAAVRTVQETHGAFGTNIRVQMHEKTRALELLAKILGLLVESGERDLLRGLQINLTWSGDASD